MDESFATLINTRVAIPLKPPQKQKHFLGCGEDSSRFIDQKIRPSVQRQNHAGLRRTNFLPRSRQMQAHCKRSVYQNAWKES